MNRVFFILKKQLISQQFYITFVNNKKDSTIKIKISGAKSLYQKDRKYPIFFQPYIF